MVIRIPASTTPVNTTPVKETAQPQGVAQSGCREMHKVKRKETLYSIARDFNLTEAELKAANPEMNEPGYKLRKETSSVSLSLNRKSRKKSFLPMKN